MDILNYQDAKKIEQLKIARTTHRKIFDSKWDIFGLLMGQNSSLEGKSDTPQGQFSQKQLDRFV